MIDLDEYRRRRQRERENAATPVRLEWLPMAFVCVIPFWCFVPVWVQSAADPS
jgi:hypothetical protein